jgi:alpha-tubulin suppressor-like RCC1 family protein
VSAGYAFSGAIKTDGTRWAWGQNQFGQLGIGNIAYYSSPIQVGSLTNWKQVSSGGQYSLAITANS